MQTKEQIEDWYKIPDRWQYFHSEDDAMRKKKLMDMLPQTYENALDIGCGECFIAKDLPAKNIYGIEWSDIAASRFPENVKRVLQPQCDTSYDLVISTGTLYPQYDHKQIYEWIMEASSKHILIAGIKEWIMPYDFAFANLSQEIEFKYLNYTQIARLYTLK
jgi:hypothetical protein